MAKAPTPIRAAVTARGLELLALIAASEAGFLMLTQDEGAEAVAAGDALIDPSIAAEGETAAVRLTEAGAAKLAASAPPATVPGIELDTDVPMPGGRQRKGRSSVYPFDKMEVGNSFHVAKTADNENPADRLASSVSGARAKYSVPTGETEIVKVKVYAKGADGKFLKGPDGKRVVSGETTKERPKMTVTRDFAVYTVDASDPKGEGARVFRIA